MTPDDLRPEPARRVLRAAIWLPGLAVALGAAVATAHGLYEVAVAAQVPAGIAWLYPLITDGLALVAYTATARLHGSAGRYAWSVVVLAAGLSGIAQASYLAGGATLDAPPALRFGVGAWPAVAAAIVAHLLYLLMADAEAVQSVAERPYGPVVRPDADVVQPIGERPSGPAIPTAVQRSAQRPAVLSGEPERKPSGPTPVVTAASGRPVESPTRDRARVAAQRHAARSGALPTVTQLMDLAEVSRGTAGDALKALRDRPAPLHLVDEADTPRTQP